VKPLPNLSDRASELGVRVSWPALRPPRADVPTVGLALLAFSQDNLTA